MADLRKYNVLILPDSDSLGRILDSEAVEKIKGWVEKRRYPLIAVGRFGRLCGGKERHALVHKAQT